MRTGPAAGPGFGPAPGPGFGTAPGPCLHLRGPSGGGPVWWRWGSVAVGGAVPQQGPGWALGTERSPQGAQDPHSSRAPWGLRAQDPCSSSCLVHAPGALHRLASLAVPDPEPACCRPSLLLPGVASTSPHPPTAAVPPPAGAAASADASTAAAAAAAPREGAEVGEPRHVLPLPLAARCAAA